MTSNQMMNALKIASQAHKGQKYGNVPYIFHPVKVSLRLSPERPDLQIAALLHDVLEDSPTTGADLLALGVSWDVVMMVTTLTRKKGEAYDLYIERVATDESDAALVKWVDLIENLSNDPPDSLKKRYRNALKILSDHRPDLGLYEDEY